MTRRKPSRLRLLEEQVARLEVINGDMSTRLAVADNCARSMFNHLAAHYGRQASAEQRAVGAMFALAATLIGKEEKP